MEKLPLNTRDQTPRHLSTERSTEKVLKQEAVNEPPLDHKSDQEESKDKESSSEFSQRADRLESIREFQEIMNKAIEQLLNKPVRNHTHRKTSLNQVWNRRSIGKSYAG